MIFIRFQDVEGFPSYLQEEEKKERKSQQWVLRYRKDLPPAFPPKKEQALKFSFLREIQV